MNKEYKTHLYEDINNVLQNIKKLTDGPYLQYL